jgi:ABC-type glycerol-3-phosphate transport system substrate-binding protein
MKKYFLFVLTLLACFALVGCGGGDDNGGEQKKTTLTYASWGDATLEQAMIDAFMEKYPHIKVLRDTTITGTGNVFTENLIKASQAGTLPDVFVTDNVPNVIAAGIARDVSTYWNKDPDAQLVYEKNFANRRLQWQTFVSSFLSIRQRHACQLDASSTIDRRPWR